MKISIHGDHVKITESIKEYVESKLSKLTKYFDESSEIEAIVKVRIKGEEQIIEVTLPTKLFTIRAEEKNKDLYAGIDSVQKKLENQIKKNKAKISKHFKDKKGFIMAEFEEEPENTEDNLIVRRKEIDFKPMDEEEAILQMELVNHDFFVFKNNNEKCTSVVYKRKDGTYGIINAR